MKKLNNRINITGIVVDCTFEVKDNRNGDSCITGDLILRTDDNSEHTISYYSNEFKKGSNEVNSFFTDYERFKDNVITLKNCEEDEEPTVVRISDGEFNINDYKNKETGELVNFVKINGRWLNERNILKTSKKNEATFNVTGIIDSITDEIKNNEVTGDLLITLSVFKQMQNKDDKTDFEVVELFPMEFKVKQNIADEFKKYFNESDLVSLQGNVVNRIDTKNITVSHTFGGDETKVINVPIREYEIKTGDIENIYDIEGLTPEVIEQLREKRKVKLREIKNGVVNPSKDNNVKPTKNFFKEAAETIESEKTTTVKKNTKNPFRP